MHKSEKRESFNNFPQNQIKFCVIIIKLVKTQLEMVFSQQIAHQTLQKLKN